MKGDGGGAKRKLRHSDSLWQRQISSAGLNHPVSLPINSDEVRAMAQKG